MKTIPKQINAIKAVTYDVDAVIHILKESGNENPSFQDVMGAVEAMVETDFSDPNQVMLIDEEGDEL